MGSPLVLGCIWAVYLKAGGLVHAPFKLFHKLFQRQPHRLTELAQLNDIHPPFAALALADERLSFPQTRRHLFLGNARLFARLTQAGEEMGVGSGADRLLPP